MNLTAKHNPKQNSTYEYMYLFETDSYAMPTPEYVNVVNSMKPKRSFVPMLSFLVQQ